MNKKLNETKVTELYATAVSKIWTKTKIGKTNHDIPPLQDIEKIGFIPDIEFRQEDIDSVLNDDNLDPEWDKIIDDIKRTTEKFTRSQ